jgi:hypothetical protein
LPLKRLRRIRRYRQPAWPFEDDLTTPSRCRRDLNPGVAVATFIGKARPQKIRAAMFSFQRRAVDPASTTKGKF